jgi:hypothetical protein
MNMNTLPRRMMVLASVLLVFFTLIVPTVAAQTAQVVVPSDLATVEGNIDNAFPFNVPDASFRYQQVYAASDFASLSAPQLITEIAFRPDGVFGEPFTTTIPSVQIRLATTTTPPDGLSSVFANNVGADDAIVFAGALTLSSSFAGPVGGPKAFDVVIPLQTPFVYNPARGNLLLDMRVFSGVTTSALDAHESVDATSRVYIPDSDSATGDLDTIGLVTRFTMAPVEPVAQTKDDCKNGRWHTHTRADGSRFKNEGDCIQYVNTGK